MLKKCFHSAFSIFLLFSFVLGLAQMGLHALEHEAVSSKSVVHAHDHSKPATPSVAEYEDSCGLCAQFASNFAYTLFAPYQQNTVLNSDQRLVAPNSGERSEAVKGNGSRAPPAV
jgi:uncharacterized SAM-dependent methyltransferase